MPSAVMTRRSRACDSQAGPDVKEGTGFTGKGFKGKAIHGKGSESKGTGIDGKSAKRKVYNDESGHSDKEIPVPPRGSVRGDVQDDVAPAEQLNIAQVPKKVPRGSVGEWILNNPPKSSEPPPPGGRESHRSSTSVPVLGDHRGERACPRRPSWIGHHPSRRTDCHEADKS